MDKLQAQEYLSQGAVLAGQGKYDEALSYYDKAEHEDPMEIEVYLSKGIALANLERLDEAKTQFEKALKINRTSGVAHFHIGNLAVLQGEISLGFENYNKAISNGYDDAQVYFSIGLLHEENGEFEMAVRNYSKAITKNALRPDIRIRKASLLIQGNLIPEALQTIDETILTNPDVFEGYHLKFIVLLQLKQYDKAEELLDQAIGLFPEDTGFAFDRVSLHIEKKEYDTAVALLDNLESADNVDNETLRKIHMEKAQIHAVKNDVKSAISSLEGAEALSADSEDYDSEVAFLLANCHLAAEDYGKVLTYARQLLEKGEDGYNKETARYLEPLALKMLGRMDEAMPLYTEAISEYRNQSLAAPGVLDAYLLRVMCLRDIEQYDKALELIDYVVTLKPEQAEPRVLRATILEALGRTDEAAKESKIANSMLPDELRK